MSSEPPTTPEIILPLTFADVCADYLAGLTELPETAEIPAAEMGERYMIEETYLRR